MKISTERWDEWFSAPVTDAVSAESELSGIVACMKSVITSFQNRNGATICRLLKGVGTGKVLRECPDCVADACEFLEEMLPEEAKKRL